jgi:epoxyqueuosine reductase QueG
VPGYTLRREMPGARSVISFAMSSPPELRRSGPLQGAVGTLMHHICLRIARMVEDYGYHAASYNWAHDLGEMAGLGKRGTGEFRELETPEFGNCVITGAVVTDALLDPTPAPEKADRPIAARTLTPKKLRQRLDAVADANLVSLLGVAPVSRFDKTVADLKANVNEAELGERVDDVGLHAHGPWISKIVKDTGAKIRGPKDYMPEAKSIIVFGMHTPQELVDNTALPKSQQIGTYAFWQYQTYRELCNAAFYMAKFLSSQGHKVLAVDDMLGVGSRTATPRGRFPDHRANAIEGVAAGLGQVGANGGLLSPEYGAQQRLMVLITDADLPADEVYKGKDLCVKCGACVSKCPMHAFEKTTFAVHVDGITVSVPRIERHRCDWSKRYSLCALEGPALIGVKTDEPAPEGRRVTIEDVAAACEKKDRVGKHIPCTVEMCTRHCPAHAAK